MPSAKPAPGSSFADKHPEHGVTAGSSTRAHWRCHACGRRWQARSYSHMQGRSRCKCVQSPR